MEESTPRRLGAGRLAGVAALAGAVVQVACGVVACVWTYPRITGRPFEAAWGLATLGMIASVVAWLDMALAGGRQAAAGAGGGAARAPAVV